MIKFLITYFLLLLLVSNVSVFAQDTTFLEPKQLYFSKNGDSVRFMKPSNKRFPDVHYSQEKIQLALDSFKIEYCYYYDNKRYTNAYSSNYSIHDDSVLIFNNQKWMYYKLNDSLTKVINYDFDYKITGTVSSLIPFVKHGEFKTFRNSGKVIFIEYFSNNIFIKIEYPKYKLADSVYTKVDSMPKFPEKYGDLKTYILNHLEYPVEAMENSIAGSVIIRTVITSKGEIIISEILRSVDPLLDKEAIKVIANLPDFEPGKINGENVNTYYVIPVKFIY